MAGSFEEAVKSGIVAGHMYVYGGLTDAEQKKFLGDYTIFNGTYYLATLAPIKALETKLLLPEGTTIPPTTTSPVVTDTTPIQINDQESYINHLPTGSVIINGNTTVGQTLKVTTNITDDDGLGDMTYQWFSNGKEIVGATDTSYKLATADVGNKINVKTSYIDGEGTTEIIISSNTAIVKSSGTVAVSRIPTPKNDYLVGTDGNDTISALAGNDTLIGGLGVDKLSGGSEADTFKYNSVDDSSITSKTRDTITDFNSVEGDKIDLSAIDANLKLKDDQAFTFIGNKAFSNTDATGQLRFDSVSHILYASTDADNIPEFSILLSGVKSLAISDLIL